MELVDQADASVWITDQFDDVAAAVVVDCVPGIEQWVIVTDLRVERIGHAKTVANALKAQAGNARVWTLAVAAGEASKDAAVKDALDRELQARRCTRRTCLVAVGGGVVGDLAGFVAATYMRGVPIVQIPTTLLAMVDSSVGGKTGIDSVFGKNLVGAFHTPVLVILATAFLTTLPRRQLANGLAEAIKAAAMGSAAEFARLEVQAARLCADSLGETVRRALQYKMGVVRRDPKEAGERAALNFGHTFGHAIESLAAPRLLHGEAVAIGMVVEAEIAVALGAMSEQEAMRLLAVLSAAGLPVGMDDMHALPGGRPLLLAPEKVRRAMELDKKNLTAAEPRFALPDGIGRCLQPRDGVFVTGAPPEMLALALAPCVTVSSLPENDAETVREVRVPGSKSISNRCLLMAALGAGPCEIRGLLHSEDTRVMMHALSQVVEGLSWEYADRGRILRVRRERNGPPFLRPAVEDIYVSNAGTAARFLTALLALGPCGGTVIRGTARMHQRPIGALVAALRANGAQITCLEREGYLPLRFERGGALRGGLVKLDATLSSQYVSAVLLAGPMAAAPLNLQLQEASVVSEPYISMTVAMMRAFGVSVSREARDGFINLAVPVGGYNNPAGGYDVEGDASSATYPLAVAAIRGTRVRVVNVDPSTSLQGDAQFAVEVLQRMGCTVTMGNGVTVSGPSSGQRLRGLGEICMANMTDAFLTAAVLASVADGDTVITGVSNQRVKECDRINALECELRKFGALATATPDGLRISGKSATELVSPEDGVFAYNDHRVAMAFSILAAARGIGGATLLRNRRCVDKTWPFWWQCLSSDLGLKVCGAAWSAVDLDRFSRGARITDTTESTVETTTSPRVVIVGLRGAGKTTVGRLLANLQGCSGQFADMDEVYESENGRPIAEAVAADGWAPFRAWEEQRLVRLLKESPPGSVIATGGGCIESEAVRKALSSFAEAGNIVVWLMRSLEATAASINGSSPNGHRAPLGEPLETTWARRWPFYLAVSNAAVFVDDASPENAARAVADRISKMRFSRGQAARVCSDVFGPRAMLLAPPHAMLCLAEPTYRGATALGPLRLERIVQGHTCVEVRIDQLESAQDPLGIAAEISTVRGATGAKIPLVYTVRRKSQGGAFAGSSAEYRRLVRFGALLGCEIVDVEVDPLDSDDPTGDVACIVAQLNAFKSRPVVLASFHDTQGALPWTAASLGPRTAQTSNETGTVALYSMSDVLAAAAGTGADAVKLVGLARDPSANHHVALLRAHAARAFPQVPLVALCMGVFGQQSRLECTSLTPVTSSELGKAAAPGQLTLEQIVTGRRLMGLDLPNGDHGKASPRFMLLGSPVNRSLSPLMHNSIFQKHGLPSHWYRAVDAPNARAAAEAFLQLKTVGQPPQVLGASVTIPNKRDVVSELEKLLGRSVAVSAAARAIGAVNTLVWTEDGLGGILAAHNTDYLAIRDAVCGQLLAEGENRKRPPIRALVLGAGGTAAAAVHALRECGAEAIFVWTRTPRSFTGVFAGCRPALSFADVWAGVDNAFEFIVVGAVPAAAQTEVPLKPLLAELQHAALPREMHSVAIVEMAYTPQWTTLLRSAAESAGLAGFSPDGDPRLPKRASDGAFILGDQTKWRLYDGVTLLLLQGFYQSRLWLGREPPIAAVCDAVYQAYGREQVPLGPDGLLDQ